MKKSHAVFVFYFVGAGVIAGCGGGETFDLKDAKSIAPNTEQDKPLHAISRRPLYSVADLLERTCSTTKIPQIPIASIAVDVDLIDATIIPDWQAKSDKLNESLFGRSFDSANPFWAHSNNGANNTSCLTAYPQTGPVIGPVASGSCEAIATFPSLVGIALQGHSLSDYRGVDWVASSVLPFLAPDHYGKKIFSNNIGGLSNSLWYTIHANQIAADLTALSGDIRLRQALGEAALGLGRVLDEPVFAIDSKLTYSSFRRHPISRGSIWYEFRLASPARYWRRSNQSPVLAQDPGDDGLELLPNDYPQAPIGIAYVNYANWLMNGDRASMYRAIQGMNVVERMPDDYVLAYEFIAASGPYLAARMNAEIGTNFDLNRIYNKTLGVRGSGNHASRIYFGSSSSSQLQGTVGGDIGLNDYVFAANSFLQASRYLAATRFDLQHAEAIARYAYASGINSRRFFLDDLPETLQSQKAIEWANKYDLGRAHGYEAVRLVDSRRPVQTADYPFPQSDNPNQPVTIYGPIYAHYFKGLKFIGTDQKPLMFVNLNMLDPLSIDDPVQYLVYNPNTSAYRIELPLKDSRFYCDRLGAMPAMSRSPSGGLYVTVPPNGTLLLKGISNQ